MSPIVRKMAAGSLVVLLQLPTLAAHAHHPTGGMTPTSFVHGLLSGIGHPILGLDHFAFIVGIGLLAAIAGFGLLLPALFVAAMVAGLTIHIAGISVPFAEVLLALSVVLMGVAVYRRRVGQGPWLEGASFGLAGLLHGYAFAETVIGAEPTPVLAYIVGLAATQMTIAYGAWYVARAGTQISPYLAPIAVRAFGLVIAVVGILHLYLNGVTAG